MNKSNLPNKEECDVLSSKNVELEPSYSAATVFASFISSRRNPGPSQRNEEIVTLVELRPYCSFYCLIHNTKYHLVQYCYLPPRPLSYR